jgi:hypothetical protein
VANLAVRRRLQPAGGVELNHLLEQPTFMADLERQLLKGMTQLTVMNSRMLVQIYGLHHDALEKLLKLTPDEPALLSCSIFDRADASRFSSRAPSTRSDAKMG